ncbi:MAG: hypothetical protein IANPNBLG_02522 [Bryobacteraceae bacterium]|nr:hypothetical protein [Bryobacteraceae bacterium]
MIITAGQYDSTPVHDLLSAAARGHVGVDQRLLRSILSRGDEAIEDVVRFGLEERFDDRINLDEDLLAIIQYAASPKAIPYLLDLLKRESADPPEDLVHALQRIGEPAIAPLIALYEELGPEMGSGIAFVIAAFPHRDPAILKTLRERVSHDPSDAAFLLGVHGDPAGIPILRKLKERALVNQDLAESLGNEADEALALLAGERKEETPEPINLWDLYPEYIEPVFDVMTLEEKLEFLHCPSAELRADCATSFIDRDVPSAVRDVLVKLAAGDPNVGVRSVACTALAGHADDEKIFGMLLGKLENSTLPPAERCGALLGIAAAAKAHPEVKNYIEEFYANPATTARAMEAMWRSLDASYAPFFRRHLNDADIDIRRQAIKGTGFLELSSEAPRLLELMRDDEFRLDALFSYAMAVPIDRLQRGDMPQVLKKIENLAGGLSDAEGEVVETALDTRLVLHGLEPVFLDYAGEEENG